MIPARVAASRSTLSTPTPARPMTDEPRPGGDQLGVDLDLAADDERVVVAAGSPRSSSRVRPVPLVDLVVGAQELDALAGDGLGDEDPHAPAPAAAGAPTPNDSSAATWAAATAAPGPTGRPGADRDDLEGARSRRGSPRAVTEPEVAEPEDLAGQLALAAGEDDAAALDLAVERLPVEVVGDDARR